MESPTPFIKDEPDDFPFQSTSFLNTQHSSHAHGQQYDSWHGSNGNVDPSDLNMSGNLSQRPFGSSTNLSSSFIAGNSGVTDDDLLGSLDLGHAGGNMRRGSSHHMHNDSSTSQHNFQSPQNYVTGNHNSIPMHPRQQQSYGQNYSHTPEGAPINSPFVNGFDFSQWQSLRTNQQMAHPPGLVSRPGFATERNSSISKSPMTPMTPGMGNLQIGTPDTGSFPGQSIPNHIGHRKTSSQQWDSSLGSGYSYLDSPLSSPSTAQHAQISEVLKTSNAMVSPPSGITGLNGKTRPSVEDKKARRRASHNEVERKRRNNINNQITTLSRLVPTHRLEDDNIRRALNSNTSLPPNITTQGMSPPQATSLLAGGTGRRAAGGITQGLPIDDKDKAPAKGDVLNSAVGWTKDLMWLLNRMMHRETIMQETIEQLGGQAPVQINDEENRMRTELLDTFQRNSVDAFRYSRRHGSNLWVPGHTDPTGALVTGDAADVGAAAGAAGLQVPQNGNGASDHQFWGYPTDNSDIRSSIDFKEEDEYAMETMDM